MYPAICPGPARNRRALSATAPFKLVYAYAEASVPKLTLVIRKAYGGAYIGMGSRGLGADLVMSWPTGELAVMGPDGAAPRYLPQGMRRPTARAALLAQKIDEFRKKFANPYMAAAHLHIDDVIIRRYPQALNSRVGSPYEQAGNSSG